MHTFECASFMEYSHDVILQMAGDPGSRPVLFEWLVDQWQKPVYYYVRHMVL
ncbi:MAG: hypothetical protein JNM00_03320, partial [Flavobacteriales bacterium]|nr:hypothetical protein [Flavobacteriales bacterium]